MGNTNHEGAMAIKAVNPKATTVAEIFGIPDERFAELKRASMDIVNDDTKKTAKDYLEAITALAETKEELAVILYISSAARATATKLMKMLTGAFGG